MTSAKQEVLRELAQRIREIENAPRQARGGTSLTGSPLAVLVPEGRLPAGSLVELLAASEGAGAWTLALLLAQSATRGVPAGAQAAVSERALVIVDIQECFYPPAAVKWGIDLARTVVIRSLRPRQAYAAFQQALRCPAVGAVIGWFERLSVLDVRRLQLAAESSGSVGLLLRPKGALRQPSFAALRLLLTPLDSPTAARRVRLEVVRSQDGKAGHSILLEIDDETGHVRVPAGLAPATSGT